MMNQKDEPTVIDGLLKENTRLRAALALSDRPCVYCTLPADKWGECVYGFPGCSRSDDAMGCPELGASLRAKELSTAIDRLKQYFTSSNGVAVERATIKAEDFFKIIGER